jgi:hypothetical protein
MVPVALGVDQYHRAFFAKLQATGAGDHDVVQAAVGQFRLQVTQQIGGIFLDTLALGLQAPETHTHEDMMFRFFHENRPPR